MSKPITKIRMSGFRGATSPFELTLDPAKDITMLFGENGSGKSTILDGIDVVCNDTIGCLEGVSLGRSAGRFLSTLGSQPASLRVTVNSNGESWTGTMRRSIISVSGGGERPCVSTLRRNQVLELVTAQPSDRYRALSQFIDTAVVERSESNLREKVNSTNRELETWIRDKERMATQLDELWVNEGRPGQGFTAIEWAKDRVDTGIQGLNEILARLQEVDEVLARANLAKIDHGKRKEIHSGAAQRLIDVSQEISDAPGTTAATAVDLLESLEKAKAYIEAEDPLNKCPTCQRPIERDELLGIVNQEVNQLSDLKALADRRSTIQGEVNVATSHLGEATSEFIEALKMVEATDRAGDIPELVALQITWPSFDETADGLDEFVAICGHLVPVQGAIKEQRINVQAEVSQFNSMKQRWDDIREANEKTAELQRILDGLRLAYSIVHERRVVFTQDILDDICQEANRLFQELHPGENIGLEQLKMEEERRGSVSQAGTFNGHTDIPPQAVFSESHMDTLGFCVWLALAKREEPEATILLIDDIFSSVDATHLGRIIDLLNAEVSNFLQVIVATHFRLWWDRCQNAQGTQRIHLGRWCAVNGIAAQNVLPVLEELRVKVADAVLDRQAVSSRAGILLESILDDLALLYARPLPRNKLNEYTLGELINGCSKLFTRHSLGVEINARWDAEGPPEDWQPSDSRAAFDQVAGLQFIRNQVGCHFSPPGMEIPDDEVRGFGAATIALVGALACPSCGALATKKSNDGTHLRCTCTKRAVHMTPVAI